MEESRQRSNEQMVFAMNLSEDIVAEPEDFLLFSRLRLLDETRTIRSFRGIVATPLLVSGHSRARDVLGGRA